MADQPTMTPPVPDPYPASPKTGMAVGALVCGILGFCIPGLGLVGLILGIVALTRAGGDPARHGGKGMAVAGLSLGAVSLVVVPVMALMISIMLPSLARAREIAKRTVCTTNMHAVGGALLSYASDNDGAFPVDIAKALNDSGLSPKVLNCPSCDQSNYRYIPGWSTNDSPQEPVVYEPLENHDGEGGCILYLDGHAEFVNKDRWTRVIGPYESRSVPISSP